MNEENRKKREWVKSAAIVFLAVMLVLTFFSNTIMNYSLPEAATQTVMSGKITTKIRGTGVVESGEAYNVEVTESRKIAGVAVRQGQEVAIGDVILYLEDVESAELTAALKTLEQLQSAYDKAILTGTVDKSVADKVEKGQLPTVAEYQNKLAAAKAAVEAAQKQYDEAAAWQKALQDQISMSSQVAVDTSAEEKAYNEAQLAHDNMALEVENRQLTLDRALQTQADAEAALNAAEAEYEAVVSGGDAATVAAARQKVDAARQKVNDAQTAAATAQKGVTEAQVVLEQKKQALNTARANLNAANAKAENARVESNNVVANLQKQLATAQYNASMAQESLADKQEAFSELVQNINTEMDLTAQMDAIREQQEAVEKLREKSVGATVTADIAGTVTAVNVVAGQSTTPGVAVAVIQPAGKGFTMSFAVTNEQAQRVSVGDSASLVNSWWYNDITAKLTSIRPDPGNPSKQKQLTFELSGDLMAGQSLTLAVGERSAQYDLVVPNSALREDNNGKFVLIVEQKSSPLGNRYQATRVDVEVLASDDTQSAVRGALQGWENVITTSNKPIEAGQLIRLPD